MYTVEDVSEKLSVSKVTIYSKLKKFDDMVVLKQGKKYITDDLFNLIKEDLKLKNNDNNNLNIDNDLNSLNDEIATDTDDLINLNKDLISALIEQLRQKDKQIEKLHGLIENNQVLLKQEKEVNQLQLEQHIKELDVKLNDAKDKMEKRREDQKQEKKKGLLGKFFK